MTQLSRRLGMILSVVVLCAAPTARADDIDNLGGLTQAQFKALATDLTAALAYRAISPAEPLGLLGFDVGVGISLTETSGGGVWRIATGSGTDYLPMPRLMVQKGLPLGFDVGASYAAVPGSNIKAWGAELKYALLEGGTATPAVALRGAISRMSGVDDLKVDTESLEVVVSKGFLNLTPYGGIGQVWGGVKPSANSVLGAPLRKESPTLTRVHAGLGFSVLLVNFTVEVESMGGQMGGSTRFGLRW
jgi:hypothetical protein